VVARDGPDSADTSEVPGQPSVQLGDGYERLSAAPNDTQLRQDVRVEEASTNADAVGGLGRGQREPASSRRSFHAAMVTEACGGRMGGIWSAAWGTCGARRCGGVSSQSPGDTSFPGLAKLSAPLSFLPWRRSIS
jgi:hypothetical protein